MGQSLKKVNPQYHRDQLTSAMCYGVTEVFAMDGYSTFITAKSVMPLKNNIVIYKDMFC